MTNPNVFEPGRVASKFAPQWRHALSCLNTCSGKCGSYWGNWLVTEKKREARVCFSARIIKWSILSVWKRYIRWPLSPIIEVPGIDQYTSHPLKRSRVTRRRENVLNFGFFWKRKNNFKRAVVHEFRFLFVHCYRAKDTVGFLAKLGINSGISVRRKEQHGFKNRGNHRAIFCTLRVIFPCRYKRIITPSSAYQHLITNLPGVN